MTDFSEKASFNSSTYKKNVHNGPLVPSIGCPLSEQTHIQEFLNAPNTGPLPEILLYRLLTVAELYLQERFPEKKLGGLCIGYFLESDVNFYYVSWGWIPEYEFGIKIIREKRSDIDFNVYPANEKDVPNNLEEAIALEELARLIEVELNQQLNNTSDLDFLRVFILNHFHPMQETSEDIFTEIQNNNGDQFTILLDSTSELQSDADSSFRVPLNTIIALNSNLILSANSTSLNFAISRASVNIAESSHKHRNVEGEFRYKADPHFDCERIR